MVFENVCVVEWVVVVGSIVMIARSSCCLCFESFQCDDVCYEFQLCVDFD